MRKLPVARDDARHPQTEVDDLSSSVRNALAVAALLLLLGSVATVVVRSGDDGDDVGTRGQAAAPTTEATTAPTSPPAATTTTTTVSVPTSVLGTASTLPAAPSPTVAGSGSSS